MGTWFLLAAEDALPNSQQWWEITLAWLLRFGAIAGALVGISKLVERLAGQMLKDWREARSIRRNQPLLRAIAQNTDAVRQVDAKVDARHRHNTREIEDVNRNVNRVAVQVKEIHKRIDDHMEEEREERHQDRAELMGFLQQVAFMRRDDVQRLRHGAEERRTTTEEDQ